MIDFYKELKNKYKKLFTELNASFTDENLRELAKFHYHLQDKNLLKQYTPHLKKNDRGQVYEQLVLNEPVRVQAIKENNLVLLGSPTHYQAYQEAQLSNFITPTPERIKLAQVAKKLVTAIKNNQPTHGLYLYGRNRVGKTFLASAIANSLITSKKVVMVFLPDFIRTTFDFNNNNLEANIFLLKNCDLLILDDLGAGIKSTWFRDAILLPVIQERLNNHKPIIITSNNNFEGLVIELAKDKNNMATQSDHEAAMRIVGRISEMCTPYIVNDFKGADK